MSTTPRAFRKSRVAVLGEHNSGKTTLVNAIAGAPVLASSPLLRTAYPTVVTYAHKRLLAAEMHDRRRVRLSSFEDAPAGVRRFHIGVPSPALAGLSLIDAPPTDADDDGDAPAVAICRTAQLVIWCTPAIQAWKASEERAWVSLPARLRARGILAVTFADLVSPGDLDRLIVRLQRDAGGWFRTIVTGAQCVQLVSQLAPALAPSAAPQRAAQARDWLHVA